MPTSSARGTPRRVERLGAVSPRREVSRVYAGVRSAGTPCNGDSAHRCSSASGGRQSGACIRGRRCTTCERRGLAASAATPRPPQDRPIRAKPRGSRGKGRKVGWGLVFSRVVSVPRGERRGVEWRAHLKRGPSILASRQVRVPVTPSTERHQVRGLIRSPMLGAHDVVNDEAGRLAAFGAAVTVSLPYPCSRLPPGCRVERRAGGTRPAYPCVLGTREWATAVTEADISHLGPSRLSFAV